MVFKFSEDMKYTDYKTRCEKCGKRYSNFWCKWCKLCQTSGNEKIDDTIYEM